MRDADCRRQDSRIPGQQEYRTEGFQDSRNTDRRIPGQQEYRTEGIQGSRNTGHKDSRRAGIQYRRDTGQKVYKTRRRQDRKDAGQEGYKTGKTYTITILENGFKATFRMCMILLCYFFTKKRWRYNPNPPGPCLEKLYTQ